MEGLRYVGSLVGVYVLVIAGTIGCSREPRDEAPPDSREEMMAEDAVDSSAALSVPGPGGAMSAELAGHTELGSAMMEIRDAWAKVDAFRGRMEFTAFPPDFWGFSGAMQGLGVYEFQREPSGVRSRLDVTWRFGHFPESLSSAVSTADVVHRVPGGGAIKVLEVFDGTDVFVLTTVQADLHSEDDAAPPPVVMHTTPGQMGISQIPGRFGEDFFDPYLEDGWRLDLLDVAMFKDKPVYCIQAVPPAQGEETAVEISRRLYFDKDTGAPVRVVQEVRPDIPAACVTIVNTEINPVIHAERFVFQAPPDAQVISEAEMQEIMGYAAKKNREH